MPDDPMPPMSAEDLYISLIVPFIEDGHDDLAGAEILPQIDAWEAEVRADERRVADATIKRLADTLYEMADRVCGDDNTHMANRARELRALAKQFQQPITGSTDAQ